MNGHVLVYRDGSPGCLRVLGIPTLLVNGGMIFGGVELLRRAGQAPWLGASLLGLGVLGVLFGWIMLWSRNVVEIDRAQRIVRRTWSALLPLERDEVPLDAFRTVALCRVLHRTRYRWIVSHAVELRGPGRSLRLRGMLDEAPAHATALEASAFTALPFEDARRPAADLIAEARPSKRAVLFIVLATLVAVFAIATVMMLSNAPAIRPSSHGRGKR